MRKQKKPILIIRNARKIDLKKINRKFRLTKKFSEKDLEGIALYEVDGKLVGMQTYKSGKNFFEATQDELVRKLIVDFAKTKNSSIKKGEDWKKFTDKRIIKMLKEIADKN